MKRNGSNGGIRWSMRGVLKRKWEKEKEKRQWINAICFPNLKAAVAKSVKEGETERDSER